MSDIIEYGNGSIIYSAGSIPERTRALMFDNLIDSLNNKSLLITLVNPALEVSNSVERSLNVHYINGRVSEGATDGDIVHILGQIIRETETAHEATSLMKFIYKELELVASNAIISIEFSELVDSIGRGEMK